MGAHTSESARLESRPGNDALLELLIVEIAGQRCALLLASVRRLYRAVALAPVPSAPAIIEGAINVQGQAIPVLDFRRRLGLPRKEVAPDDHLVIATAGARLVAIRVDRALELVSVAPGVVQAAATLSPHIDGFAGVVALPDGVVLIHDLETFLTEAERAEIDAALSVAASAGGAA